MKKRPIDSYSAFDEFIFRVPIWDINALADLDNVPLNGAFKEAIYLASLPFYKELYAVDYKTFGQLPPKLKRTTLKYMLRMATRCTPFGLFSGCGIGTLGDDNTILLDAAASFKSRTTVNARGIIHLAKRLTSSPEIKNHLLYYPNPSLLKIGDHYRYTELKYSHTGYELVLSQVTHTSFLESLLDHSIPGMTLSGLALMLSGLEEVDLEDAMEYVQEMAASQLILHEFDLHVTKDNLAFFSRRLKEMEDNGSPMAYSGLLQRLTTAQRDIDDRPVGNRIAQIIELDERIDGCPYKDKDNTLLQTNLIVHASTAVIHKRIPTMVKDGIRVLNLLSSLDTNTALYQFKQKFYERYEHEEIPLLEALDPEVGVSKGNFSPENIAIDPLIKGIGNFPGENNAIRSIQETVTFNHLIFKKLTAVLDGNADEIVITGSDLENTGDGLRDLPLTFSAGIEILSKDQNGQPTVLIKYSGGYSALATLARFSRNNEAFYSTARKIADFENEAYPGAIVADILFVPFNWNIANVVLRAGLRKYEIPALGTPSPGSAITIPLSDIMVRITTDNQLILRSKKLDRQIIPKGTSAHNFMNKASPVYYFLSALQAQDHIRGALYFDWFNYTPANRYFPRVSYEKNVILSLAKWRLLASDIAKNADFRDEFQKFRTRCRIPDRVLLSMDIDSKLLIDLRSEDIYPLLQTELKYGSITLEEYLVDEKDALVRSGEKIYNHEIILNFYKNELA